MGCQWLFALKRFSSGMTGHGSQASDLAFLWAEFLI